MISVKEAATKMGVSTRRIQKLVSEGRIPGAKRIGLRAFGIPPDFTVTPTDQRPRTIKQMD